MSVYSLVTGLRKFCSWSIPAVPSSPAVWLRAGLALSIAAYLVVRVYGMINDVSSSWWELTLLPAGVCGVALAVPARRKAAGAADAAATGGWAAGRERAGGLAAAAVLLAFTTTFVALNTVPTITSQDEAAIVNGGYQLARDGTLQISSDLNEAYDTNIIGGLHVMYRTPVDRYYKAFPGSALLYAPFSLLPGDSGYRLYTALFAGPAVVALYLVAWKVLRSWPAALLTALLFAASPGFGHWSVTVFNNVPVLALELTALAAVVLPDRMRPVHVAAAGALLGLAGFIRITEFAFALPLLGLVWWRTQTARECLPFIAAAAGGVVLVLVANAVSYGDAFFFPQVGTPYLSLHAASGPQHASQSLFERYFLFAIGTQGSVSNFELGDKISNVTYHIRYLGSSGFAFPFLAVAFAGVAWMIARGRRNAWPLALGIVATATIVIAIYGQQHDNYFGFGEPIVRSSFVRYSLPIYALLAIGAGAFFLEAGRMLRIEGRQAGLLLAVVFVVLAGVSIARSYDADVYGFNRLNDARKRDLATQKKISAFVEEREPALLVVGLNSMKLIDGRNQLETINYSAVPHEVWDEEFWPVISAAVRDRTVYLLISEIQAESHRTVAEFEGRYFLESVLEAHPWEMFEITPAIYEHVCVSCR